MSIRLPNAEARALVEAVQRLIDNAWRCGQNSYEVSVEDFERVRRALRQLRLMDVYRGKEVQRR